MVIKMYNIKLLNKISEAGLAVLDKDKFQITENNEDGIILRSADMHSYELNDNLLGIARAGAGVNNIPIDKCSEKGICVFNTPGANANAVRELAICCLMLASRKIVDGINWCKTLPKDSPDVAKMVEKGKNAFAGVEISGKTLGVIGLGKIGVMVANAAVDLGMDVLGYDPYMSVDAAWGLSRRVKKAASYEEMYQKCDYLTIHVPLNKETENMLSTKAFSVMKKGMRILNLSRGGLVNSDAVKEAIADGTVACYVTDFPDASVIDCENIIAIPHLGASTEESEENCAYMASKQLADYIESGIIRNSVNLPDMTEPKSNDVRITIVNRNTPNMIGQITAILAADGVNIEHMFNRAKKDYAYTVIDTDTVPTDAQLEHLNNIDGVLKVRVI